MWIVFAALSALFAGVTAILAKIGIRSVEANLATALRTVVVLVFAWLMVGMQGSYKTIGDISGYTMLFLVLSGLATGASWLCYFRALQLGDVNKVTPIDKSSTVLTLILAFLFLGEPISYLKLLCLLLIGGGTLLMIQRKKDTADTHSDIRSDTNVATCKRLPTWLLFACLSAVFASLTAILGKIGITGVESNLGTAIRTIVVLIMSWIIVFVTGQQGGIRHIDVKSWVFLILSGMTTGLSWLCYYRALHDGLTSVVVSVDKLSILVTVGFSAVFLKERLSGKGMAGLACIVAGTLLLIVG